MMNVRGDVTLQARGQKWRLWLGMSVLADLQAEYGDDFLQSMDPPQGAPPSWMPPLNIVRDIFLGALQRYHADEADRWLVDDLISENENAFNALMNGSAPDPGDATEKPAARKASKAR